MQTKYGSEALLTMQPKKVDKQKAIAMVKGGMSQTEVAEHYGCSRAAISKLMSKVKDSREALTEFRDNKAEVFEGLQAELLQAVDREKLKAGTAQQLITSAAILQDKIQVLRGNATSHTVIDLRALFAMAPADATITQTITSEYSDAE